MAQQSDMDFSPLSPQSIASNGTAPTPCDELTAMKSYIRRLQIICNEKEKPFLYLGLTPDTLNRTHYTNWHGVNTRTSKELSNKRRSNQQKRKDEDNFEFPPLRKTARKMVLESSDDIPVANQFSLLPNVIIKQVSGQLAPPHTENHNSAEVIEDQQKPGNNPLPPPIMMKITKTYREQVDTVKKYFPHLRLKTTGDYIKLYSNTTEQNRVVRQTLIGLGYKFYVITPKNERPIKVVIKGYPKTADPDHIKSDLEKEGFLPDRVTQLIGRRTKQKLPVFQVTLPRSMENLKIFDLKTLAHLNITVDGYNGKGITQCFSCNNFHHSAENCFLKPRCLKCGEEHLTKKTAPSSKGLKLNIA
ncbi:nucleic-acid-binding protein from transposon X-element [Trichonephila clavipes]|uniref:Nucleic-acid-binding protein from transposon X-element n=1 Tax=Trichonephila clavipes TaxID=2585209 RepID=A0A8X6SRD5_TRICX|nr:nucleic-acid-binding protein from transposon X-element [Trichonephila clavipes]